MMGVLYDGEDFQFFEFKTTADDKTSRFTLEVFDNGAKSIPVTGSSEWTYNVRKAVLEIRVA